MPATSHVSDMHCVVLYCRAAGSHIMTDCLFVLLMQHLGDQHRFHNHKEVETAVHEHANATPELYCKEISEVVPRC
jgi:hypothetical protein